MVFYPVDDLRDDMICLQLDHTCDARPEKRWLPAYYFNICLLDGTKIGHCDLRIGHNDKTYVGGNIGYGIDTPYRGHHYAAKAWNTSKGTSNHLPWRLSDDEGYPYTDKLQFYVMDLKAIGEATEEQRKQGLVEWADAFTAHNWEQV